MKLKMLTSYASPKRYVDAGKIAEFDAKEAKDLIDGGFAVEVGVAPEAAAKSGRPERAVRSNPQLHEQPRNEST